MRKFSIRPTFTLKGRTFKGLRGWSGKPLHPPLTYFPIAAYILAALGRRDEALTRLEQAVDEHSSRILWLRVDPRVDSLRRHPRFTTLLARIGWLD